VPEQRAGTRPVATHSTDTGPEASEARFAKAVVAAHAGRPRLRISESYVHGYGDRERLRLHDQAQTLEPLLHADTRYPPGSRVLEAGCGTGAQTVPLARNSPAACITSVDVSAASLAQAQAAVTRVGVGPVRFVQADLFALPFAAHSFDHVFVCFVLEHLRHPLAALEKLRELLVPGGTITVIEGDHGSALFHPASDDALAAIQCLVALQRTAGGDALIGRRLFPLLREAGFASVSVSPRLVYADVSLPQWVEGFTRRTFNAMVEGVRDAAVTAGLISRERFDAGLAALDRTATADGVFCYTFFKGTGRNGTSG
jgi:ubiquinone/menaquinone biosynthesis C-methylase UbiE